MLGGEENMKCRVLLKEIVIVFFNLGLFILVRILGVEYFVELGLVEFIFDINKVFIVFGLVNLNRNDVFINVFNIIIDFFIFYVN